MVRLAPLERVEDKINSSNSVCRVLKKNLLSQALAHAIVHVEDESGLSIFEKAGRRIPNHIIKIRYTNK
jgi:hypothetical protein